MPEGSKRGHNSQKDTTTEKTQVNQLCEWYYSDECERIAWGPKWALNKGKQTTRGPATDPKESQSAGRPVRPVSRPNWNFVLKHAPLRHQPQWQTPPTLGSKRPFLGIKIAKSWSRRFQQGPNPAQMVHFMVHFMACNCHIFYLRFRKIWLKIRPRPSKDDTSPFLAHLSLESILLYKAS